jgi:hypothetical protein
MTRALLKCQKEAARDKVKVDVKRGWNASKNRCLRRISSKCGRFVTIDSDSNREHGPVINFHACRRKAFAHPSGRRLVADNARHKFRLSRPKFPPITPSGRRRRNPRVVRVPRHLSGIVGILSIARFLAIVRVSAVRKTGRRRSEQWVIVQKAGVISPRVVNRDLCPPRQVVTVPDQDRPSR